MIRFVLLAYISVCFWCGMTRGCGRCSNDNNKQQMTITTVDETSDKTWLFAVDGRKRPYSFFDPNGRLVGFDVDIISKVCEVAGKKCKMTLAEFSECTTTDRDINYAGRGLMSEWFDACPGYVISPDCQGAFDFTEPYLATDASFTVLPGNPGRFDPSLEDFSKFTITHLNGAVTNNKCLKRLNKKFGTIIIARDLPEAKALLMNKTADVLFSPRTRIPDLEVLPARVHCDIGGAAVMVKKGSPLAAWWDPAFRKFVSSSGYSDLCAQSQIKYNATIKCLAPDQQVKTRPSTGLTYTTPQDKVWLFAVSGRRKPFNFLNDDGKLIGFDVDFVDLVCREAKQKCAMVLTEFTECTFTERNINYPGRGLMDGWFDACTGYADSVDRENGVDFTSAYLQSDASFTVLPGNPADFDASVTDFSKFTLTHLTGAYTNAACLNRLKKKFGKIVIAQNLPDAKQLLFNKKADVLFSPRSSIPDLETLPARVHCEKSGTAMMTKKGSGLVSWWDKAYRSVVTSGQYKALCREGRNKYSYPIKCFP